MSNIPFKITPKILKIYAEIERILGQIEGVEVIKSSPQLRKENKIKTIQSSLAIEGNTLNIDQVTKILDGKKVIGPKKEILEVQNAILVYNKISEWKPFLIKSFLKAHSIMMNDLISDAGQWRSGNVGIFQGSKVAHIAPKANRVPQLMIDLFFTLKNDKDIPPLILPCLCHYETEFIHPFSDGNGRMGRLWQTVLLTNYHPIFEFIPIENMISIHQIGYYEKLSESDKLGSSEPFLEFSLEIILWTLQEYLNSFQPKLLDQEDRIEKARLHFQKKYFSRIEYLKIFKTLSTATASRDLKFGVEKKLITKKGDKNLTRYQFN